MKIKKGLIITACLSLVIMWSFAIAGAAPVSGPPYTDPKSIYADGTYWSAVFLFSSAADTSELYELNTLGVIFRNNDLGNYPIGYRQDYSGTTAGQYLEFELSNLNKGYSFYTGPGSTNAAYWEYDGTIGSLETLFAVDLDAAAEAALATLYGEYGKALIIGFEDLTLAGSDKDFNDLIFAFAPLQPTGVPEPGTLLLLGLGLLGIGIYRRKK